MGKSDLQSFRDYLDLMKAMEPTDEPNLTWIELANILGVEAKETGIDTVELVNACLHVQSNSKIQALPQDERIRVLRSASDAISAILSHSI